MAPVIAITGGPGCGKSEAGRALAAIGVAVWDADAAVHRLLATDRAVRSAVERLFGPAVLRSDGELDRAGIAVRVFEDETARRALEGILHPPVLAELREWREKARASIGGAALVPLLFEADADDGRWDAVWCIVARDEVAAERLRARGWSNARIAAVRAAQWPLEKKAAHATVVIENNGSLEEFARLVQSYWRRLAK